MIQSLIFGTTNPAKLQMMQSSLAPLPLEIHGQIINHPTSGGNKINEREVFLYPLLGGSLVFGFAAFLSLDVLRAAYLLYHSGIALLTSAAMLTGIMEIAGTGSKWIAYFRIFWILFVVLAFLCQFVLSLKQKVDK